MKQPLGHLTLTSVVFEFFIHSKKFVSCQYLTLTSVVFECHMYTTRNNW